MSKVGKKPIEIPEGVTVTETAGVITVTGKLGTNTAPLLSGVTFSMKDGVIELSINSTEKQVRANWGTTASLIRNAIVGVTEGYKKVLEIQGVGFKAALAGQQIDLELGFSHTVHYPLPEGVTAELDAKKNTIQISGIDAQVVGQVAAEIRSLKKPEPYLGKGIRYIDEVVRRKEGKRVTS